MKPHERVASLRFLRSLELRDEGIEMTMSDRLRWLRLAGFTAEHALMAHRWYYGVYRPRTETTQPIESIIPELILAGNYFSNTHVKRPAAIREQALTNLKPYLGDR
jgi:hypothetical protein